MKTCVSIILTSVIISASFILLNSCNKEQYNYLEKTKTSQEIERIDNKLEKVYNMYLGLFSNKIQSKKESSPIYKSQELISVPIWPKRGGEYWMYVCWLQENRPEDLLSQEVWRFKKKDRETIEIIMYDIPNKRDYAEDWKKKEPLANLTINDLIENEGCTVLVTRNSENQFKLEGTPCSRNLSDAIKYIEVHGVLSADYIMLKNKMLNGDKEEVFSYKKGLQFERQPNIFPKYLEKND